VKFMTNITHETIPAKLDLFCMFSANKFHSTLGIDYIFARWMCRYNKKQCIVAYQQSGGWR
jgi:hypothetical protein